MKVALVHYWIVNWRGGEKVLKCLAELYPQADIFAHVVDPQLISTHFPGRKITTSFIARLPGARTHYQKYLPLMPWALEQLDLRGYDLVISSEAGPAKGVIVDPFTTHLCYCHSPMRYIWDMFQDYRAAAGAVTRLAMMPVFHRLRVWDQVSAQRVDHYIANSRFVAQRIHKYYRREARVIYPPVDIDDFAVSTRAEEWYLWVGQLVPYKRPDILVDAFNQSGRKLVVIGDGQLFEGLRKTARNNIQFLGWQSSASIKDHYARCRALVFPGVEDFGMVPVEAMASGKPVIALAAGGALESVVDGVSGVLFTEQSADGINTALDRFETISADFKPDVIRAGVARFSAERFREEIAAYVRTMRLG